MPDAAPASGSCRRTPGQRVPEYAGNTCEPWLARYAVVFLDRLLDSGARRCWARCHALAGCLPRRRSAVLELVSGALA